MRTVTLLLIPALAAAQAPVHIRVNAAQAQGPFKHSWNFFGYDEPNYTYMKHGPKLLKELGQLSPVPVFIRAHNLLTTGDGAAALKWGSTNAYTEDASGKPVYDWKIVDRIFDTYRDAGVKPLVEIGFMPEALTTGPAPYRHDFPNTTIKAGWAYPPKDYKKWGELVHQWVKHAVERYGKTEVESWWWEVWNEPDIIYWQSTREEYEKLYDHAADGLKRALPTARIGGPHTTGPANDNAADFLRKFLEHTSKGTNHATGKRGSPLDYIAFHPKGRPEVVDGVVQMGVNRQLQSIDRGMSIVASFPEYKRTPIILGESDPEGCAACSTKTHPQNDYRNGPLYACYTAVTTDRTMALAAKHGVNIEGMVTWAFEFEDQPYFAGFRTLATNGVDKAVLNVFRMLGLLNGSRIAAESPARVPLDSIVKDGVRAEPDIAAIAVRDTHGVAILLWNYHDRNAPAPAAPVKLSVTGLPAASRRALVEHFRIDETHSNAFHLWKQLGSPQNPQGPAYAALEAAGQLQLLGSPEHRKVAAGSVELEFPLPRQAVSLVRLRLD